MTPFQQQPEALPKNYAYLHLAEEVTQRIFSDSPPPSGSAATSKDEVADTQQQARLLEERLVQLRSQFGGRVNVAVVGCSGVGKSTLINGLFGSAVAAARSGLPETKHLGEYRLPNSPLTLYDTRGLELESFSSGLAELEQLLAERQGSQNPEERVHLVYVCVTAMVMRIEPAHQQVVKRLSKYVPVIVVLTLCVLSPEQESSWISQVKELLPEAKDVVAVLALDKPIRGYKVPSYGLDGLVARSIDLLDSDRQRQAFVSAQRADVARKMVLAYKAIDTYATASAIVGAIPIPFSDFFLLVPIQTAMLASISTIFGMDVESKTIATLCAAMGTGGLATLIGRGAMSAMKHVPGVGSIVGSFISANVAAWLTEAFGVAYAKTLEVLYREGNGKQLTLEEVRKGMRKILRVR